MTMFTGLLRKISFGTHQIVAIQDVVKKIINLTPHYDDQQHDLY